MTKGRVIILGIIGALFGGTLSVLLGDFIASGNDAVRAKAYYCGYARVVLTVRKVPG